MRCVKGMQMMLFFFSSLSPRRPGIFPFLRTYLMSLVESSFTILDPEEVTEPALSSGPGDGNRATMQNRIDLTVTFR